MDRYGAFFSYSSVRSNLDWDRFCDIELTVPPIEIQKKYVAIYEAILNNPQTKEIVPKICPILIRGSILESQGEK